MMSLSQLLVLSVVLVLSVCSVRAEDAFQNWGVFTDSSCLNQFNASIFGGVDSWQYMNRISTSDARTATTNTGAAPCIYDGAVGISHGNYECVSERAGSLLNTRVTVLEWFNSTTCSGAANQNYSASSSTQYNTTDPSARCFPGTFTASSGTQNVFFRVTCGGVSNSAYAATLSVMAIAALSVIASLMM